MLGASDDEENHLGCSEGTGQDLCLAQFDTLKELIQATNNWKRFGGQKTEQRLQ